MPRSSIRASIAKYHRRLTKALTDYRWALFYLQRLDYNPAHRQAIASAIAALLPKAPRRSVANFDTARIAERLRRDGFAVLDGLVSARQVNDITSYLSEKVCYDPFRPELSGFKDPCNAHASCLNAYYRAEDLVASSHILDLANHPAILGTIESLFEAKPTISNIQIWWLMHGFDAQANASNAYVTEPEEFHRDVDDWAQIKLFIYLTDVDDTAGPHEFIKSSHRWMLPPRQRILQLRDRSFPAVENLQILTGQAGFAWLEDTYCLHRAVIPQKKHRLILSVTYSLVRVPFWPDNVRVPLDLTRFDPYVNRIYARR